MSLEELLKELDNPSSRYPKCLIINEIGAVCFTSNNEDTKKKAEEVLQKIIEYNDTKHRATAFSWLSCIKNPGQETFRKIGEFKKNPQNKTILQEAQNSIERFKALYW